MRRLWQFLKDYRGSPLVEEGLLIGLAILVFLVIVTIVSQIIDWLKGLAEQLPGAIYENLY